MMNAPTKSFEDYRAYMEQALCWLDGTATHASSDEQRQCPKCRTKLSYSRIGLEFKILEIYCNGHSASKAARLTGCAKNTALSHYRNFSKHMELGIASLLLEGSIATNPQNIREVRSLEKALRTGSLKRRAKACCHLFMQSLNLNERMEMIFQACIAPDLNAYIRSLETRSEEKKTLKKSRALFHSRGSLDSFKSPKPQDNLWKRLRLHLFASFDSASSTPSEACKELGENWVDVWMACRSFTESK
jgi:hypothetical protein